MHMISPAERACLLKNRLFAGFSVAELDELLEKLSARAVSLPKTASSGAWGSGSRPPDLSFPAAWRRGGIRKADRRAFPPCMRPVVCSETS